MSGKIIISAVSLILVVGVALGVVVAVNKRGDEPAIQSNQKSVEIICQNTDDQKLCHDTLSSVKGLDTADPKAYIATAVKATMDSVIKAFNMSDKLTVGVQTKSHITQTRGWTWVYIHMGSLHW